MFNFKGLDIEVVSKIDPEKKALWVSDLRSGKNKQNIGYLSVLKNGEDKRGFCCLGRLCEVAIEDGNELKVECIDENDFDPYYGVRFRYGDSPYCLPIDVMDWAGICSEDPTMEFYINVVHEDGYECRYESSLAELNDMTYSDDIAKAFGCEINNFGYTKPNFTFEMIADFVEEYF